MFGVGCICPEHLLMWVIGLVPFAGLAIAWVKMKLHHKKHHHDCNK